MNVNKWIINIAFIGYIILEILVSIYIFKWILKGY